MCINGKFDFYLTNIQATSYHHSVGSICKWTMLNFFPFVSPHSFVVRAINYRLLFCILYTFILWYKECNLERESHRHRVRGTFCYHHAHHTVSCFKTNSKPKPSSAQLAVRHPSVFIGPVQHSAFWLWTPQPFFFVFSGHAAPIPKMSLHGQPSFILRSIFSTS